MLFKYRPDTPLICSFAFARSLFAIALFLIFFAAVNAHPASIAGNKGIYFQRKFSTSMMSAPV